jgi:arsenate reductase (thioredoxin)
MFPSPQLVETDDELRPLGDLFAALSDPSRIRLLNLLAQAEEVCSTDLEAITGYGASKISRHLAYLKRAGWVQDRRAGLWVFYSLRPSTGAVRAKLDRVLSVLPEFYGVLSEDAARLATMPKRGPQANQKAAGTIPLNSSVAQEVPMRSLRHLIGSKKRVLFLCQSNAARSQMAEAFLRKYGGDQFEVFSAGLTAGELHPLTHQVMAESGVDMNGQSAKGVDQFLGRKTFNYVITLCLEAEEECPRMFPGVGKILQWPFEDVANAKLPEAEKLQRFRITRDRIEQRVKEWLKD